MYVYVCITGSYLFIKEQSSTYTRIICVEEANWKIGFNDLTFFGYA